MSRLKACWLTTADELRAEAPRWDALWQRSEVSVPLARAEPVAQWLRQFAHDGVFHGLVIKDGESFVAALPLIGSRSAGFLTSGKITANSWAMCGDFLLDPQAHASAVLTLLVEALNEVPWPWLSLSPVASESPRWSLLVEAARRGGLDAIVVPSGHVGQVRIEGDWDGYRASWSANHRRYLRKAQRRANQTGRLSLDVHTAISQPDIERLMRRGCQIEDRSWKGAAGTSVLRAPGIFEWYLRQAQWLADNGQLQLSFLVHDRRPIAFEYGYRGKGTYFSHKVGYDPAYAHFSPGQVLRALLLEYFFATRDVSLVDFWGPLSDATAKFATHQYPAAKILIAPRRFLSRAILDAYAALRPCWRGLMRNSGRLNPGW